MRSERFILLEIKRAVLTRSPPRRCTMGDAMTETPSTKKINACRNNIDGILGGQYYERSLRIFTLEFVCLLSERLQ